MERYARLSYTSNPKLQQYVGCCGYLSCDEYGRYAFRMVDAEGTIQTSATKPHSVLGDVNHPVCRNIGFETLSGSAYQFDFMDVERALAGNQLGREEQPFQVGDSVYDDNGNHAVVINATEGLYYLAFEVNGGGKNGWYPADRLHTVGVSLEQRLENAALEAVENAPEGPSKNSVYHGLGM